MRITDADRVLASELGLLLIQRPEARADPAEAEPLSSARAPETWVVRSIAARRIVGTLCFTSTDCLYVTKSATGDRTIEEAVTDALRWLAPVVRHVRTGQYEGTEVIIPRFSSIRERPRALTECGARSTGADHEPMAARSELINGRSHEMCPACRVKLEERDTTGLAPLANLPASATTRQRAYVRRLLDEATRSGRNYLLDARTVDQLSCRDAAATIDVLRALKERGWKGPL